jgi:hypothetical protein
MKPASKVTREDIRSANLILIGTPQSKAVLKRFAPSLPAELMRPGIPGGARNPSTWCGNTEFARA